MSSQRETPDYHTFEEGGEGWVYVPSVMEMTPHEGEPAAAARRLAASKESVTTRSVESPLRVSELYLVATSHCNFECEYCYEREIGFLRERGRIDPETMTAQLERLAETDVTFGDQLTVTMYGGEPTVEPDLIPELADRLAAFGDRVGATIDHQIVTNGYAVTDELIDHFRANDYGITLSIDGPPELHDANRRTVTDAATYESVRETAERLLASDLQVLFESTVRTETLAAADADLVDVLRHLGGIGFDRGILAYDHYDEEGDERALRQVVRYSLNSLLTDDPVLLNTCRRLLLALLGGSPVETCPAGHGVLALDPDGVVFPCHAFVGDDSFGTDADSGQLAEMAAQFVSKRREHHPACRSCWNRHSCLSVCYFDNQVGGGDIGAFSTGCHATQVVTEETLRFLAALRNDPDEFDRFREQFARLV